MDTVRESEGGGGVTPPPANYVMDGAGATETAVGITLARRCCDWACRNGTTRNAVEISGPRAGRCGASELAGGDVEEGSENAKTATFNMTNPSAELLTCYRSTNSDFANLFDLCSTAPSPLST
jgi:hypothetical protein